MDRAQARTSPLHVFTEESLKELRRRYNKVNRWVVADMVRRSAYRFPNKPALIFNDQTLTYKELERNLNRVGNALLAMGLKKYDRVAVLAHNTIHHVLAWLGTMKAGGIYVPLNFMLKGSELAYQVNHAEASFLIVEDSLLGNIEGVLNDLPSVTHRIWSDQAFGQSAPEGWVDFNAWMADASDNEPDVELFIEDPVEVCYTSGTEAQPKGAILSNQNLLAQFMSAALACEVSEDDIGLSVMPIFHAAERDARLGIGLLMGLTNVLMLLPNPEEVFRLVQAHRVTLMFLPTTYWIMLLNHPSFKEYDLSSLKKPMYGASIMPVAVLEQILKAFPGCKVYNSYGQTETAPCNFHLHPRYALTKPGSAGMSGLNMESKLEDDDHRVIENAGIPGEIVSRGGHVFLGYFKDEERTEQAMAHGWFHTGDIGIADEDNFVSVVDRKKDMVKTGGENVSTREVEEVIYKDPRVQEVAVIGIPDPKWVEAVTAVIVPKPGENIQEEEILEICRQNLAGFKVPKHVFFVQDLPRSSSGKILKRELKKARSSRLLGGFEIPSGVGES